MSDPTDRLVRAAEIGGTISLGAMAAGVVFQWIRANIVLLVLFFGISWLHDTALGTNARKAQIATFPESAVKVTDPVFTPDPVLKIITATVRNDGPARIYDLYLSCDATYSIRGRENIEREHFTTYYHYGYVQPNEAVRTKFHASDFRVPLDSRSSIKIINCEARFVPEASDMLNLKKVSR